MRSKDTCVKLELRICPACSTCNIQCYVDFWKENIHQMSYKDIIKKYIELNQYVDNINQYADNIYVYYFANAVRLFAPKKYSIIENIDKYLLLI